MPTTSRSSSPPSTEPERTRRGAARRAAVRVLFTAFPGRATSLALLTVVGGVLPAIFAFLVGRLVDRIPPAISAGLASPDGRQVIGTLAAIASVLVLQEVAGSIRTVLATDLYRRFDEYLLRRVMAATLRVPGLDPFEDPELAAQADQAARIARFGPGELVSGLATKGGRQAEGLAAAVLVATVWPVAALVLLPAWLIVGSFLQADFYRANPFWTDPLRRATYLKRMALLPDWAKELRIFGLTGWLADHFGRQWSQVMTELWRARRVGHRVMGVFGPVVLAANLVVTILAAQAAMNGRLSLGALTVLIQGLLGMAALASQEGDVWIENGAIPVPDVLRYERAAAARSPAQSPVAQSPVAQSPVAQSPVAQAPDTQSPDTRRPGARPATGLPAREIRFERVRFGYPGRDRPVYDRLDLTIEAGRSLAIVGLNGAGKTTLIKLLTGLAVPQDGRITVDGIDLAEVDRTGWRRQVAAIFQEFVRYQLPAKDNIGFGAVELLGTDGFDGRVRQAAQRAGADGILDALPHGPDTILSRRHTGGVDLSGGQWQRIALARAMAAVDAGARMLVLDEPTAHLDVRAEADLYDRFLDLTRGLTSVVISHRFSTVRRADRIVVLEDGRIIEDGDHDELVARGGRYATLFTTQATHYLEQT